MMWNSMRQMEHENLDGVGDEPLMESKSTLEVL
jgi:hypothetical protein